MRIFITGATGFIGAAVARELLQGGHEVLALSRSPERASELVALGSEVFEGSVADLDRLRKGAQQADGIAHLAFNHDFSEFAASCEADRGVIQVLGEVAAANGGPLLVTSGTLVPQAAPGQPATEDDPPKPVTQMPRAASEEATAAVAASGARAFVVRPSHVHDATRQAALLSLLIERARVAGFSAFIGDGEQRWAAVPLGDLARLYRLALEKGEAGARYHGVSEEGVRMRDIADAVGRHLGVPARSLSSTQAEAHFGWAAHFIGSDGRATSALTRQRLGWQPTGPGLITDLDAMPRSTV